MRRRPLAALAATGIAAAGIAGVGAAPAASAAPAPRHLEGSLANGTTWIADLPSSWNGTLLLYSHGYNPSPPGSPNPPRNAPNPDTATALLARGYALAGSSYARVGWTMDTAAEDQIATLAAVTDRIGRRPARTLAVGTSMGGLVTGQLAERAGSVIDGALPTCGLMHGGVDLLNYQLDGAHAIAQLLVPAGDRPVRLADYGGSRAALDAAVATLIGAVQSGQGTAQGRARIALAAALYHLPTWEAGQPQPAPGDHDAQQLAQFRQFPLALSFTYPARLDIEANAGGNPSWNAGVDYSRIFRSSAQRAQVTDLYARAGLDLDADLRRLTRTAHVRPDPAALLWQRSTSTLTGRTAVPVLSIHTTDDILAPVQVEQEYREDVRAAGREAELRTAITNRPGHCAFTPAELVVSVQALETRVRTGSWAAAFPWRLNVAARRLDLGGADFLPRYVPATFLADRDDAGPPRR